jgi:hypothetical protein
VANNKPGKPYPPRWAMIYMLILMLCLMAWVIIATVHGGPPWEHH